MANNIYHKSNWGSPEKDGWGDVYFNPSATNKLYTRSDNYENEEGTDKALASKPDTQSVLMTPTAYNVGSMNSILPPYEVLPTELVTNGDFDTDSGWTVQSGWAIANGVATCSSGNNYVYQTAGIPANTKVTVTLEITNYTSGSIRIGSTGYGGSEFVSGLGNYSVTYTTWYNTGGVEIKSSSFVGSIDNVSVKEVRNADFTFDRNSTATRVNKEGLIETVAIDTPRLDYPLIDGVVQSEPALLLEPAATNFLQYSEDYTQTEWSRANINTPVLQTSVIAPDGSTNVYLITNSATSNPIIFDNEIGSSTNDSTFSVFVKYYNNKYFKLRIDAPTKNVLFNIQDGYIVDKNTSVNGKIEDYGNGWYRCSITHTALTTAGNAVISINDSGSISNNILQTTGLGCYIFGAQYEVNAYPTSYIKTTGSSVTRAAETCNSAGTSDDFNDSEGVLYAEIQALSNDGTTRTISLSDNTTQNYIRLFYHTVSNQIRVKVKSGNVNQVELIKTVSDTSFCNKVAARYIDNNFKLWINGFELATISSGITPSGLSELAFDGGTGVSDFYGKTKEVGVFKTALTDSELEALTSWDSFSDMATGQEYTIR